MKLTSSTPYLTMMKAERPGKALSRKRRSKKLDGIEVSGGGKLFIGLGLLGIVLALLASTKKGTEFVSTISTKAQGLFSQAFDFAKSALFAQAVPAAIAAWAPQILRAARKYNVSPFVLAGIMARESGGGVAPGYVPKGSPAGTGDFIKRTSSPYAQYANPATGLPPDGKGWGRGLMQIDYGAHNAWVTSNNWGDAQTNIYKGAELFAANLKYFLASPGAPLTIECWRIERGMPQNNISPWRSKYALAVLPCTGSRSAQTFGDPRPLTPELAYQAALAAYNAGLAGPLQAMALGLPPEAATSGQDYVSWFTTRVAAWSANV